MQTRRGFIGTLAALVGSVAVSRLPASSVALEPGEAPRPITENARNIAATEPPFTPLYQRPPRLVAYDRALTDEEIRAVFRELSGSSA
jgi:hypothetical protein